MTALRHNDAAFEWALYLRICREWKERCLKKPDVVPKRISRNALYHGQGDRRQRGRMAQEDWSGQWDNLVRAYEEIECPCIAP